MHDNWQEYRVLHRMALGQALKPVPLGRIWRRKINRGVAACLPERHDPHTFGPISTVLLPSTPFFIRAFVFGGGTALLSMVGSMEGMDVGIRELDVFLHAIYHQIIGIGIVVGGIGLVGYVATLINW